MRHGEASLSSPDHLRTLTEAGKARVTEQAQQLKPVDGIWVSPYVRAQQTFDIVQAQLNCSAVKHTELLTPDADLSELLEALLTVDAKRLLLIGHNPLFSMLASTLSTNTVRLAPADLVRLQGEIISPHCMQLVSQQ